jgi:AmmeMemoRadiSam system protein A
VLTSQDRQTLLALAKQAIENYVSGTPFTLPDLQTLPPNIRIPASIFVTLRQGHELRGCLGNLSCNQPLAHEVMTTAIAAASEDPRFEPLSADEWPQLNLEISVLSPFQRAASAKDIIPGKHGVMVQRGSRKGLFLPQVWKETGWDKNKFLNELCSTKSGLPAAAWQDPQTELWIFDVESFESSAAEIPKL